MWINQRGERYEDSGCELHPSCLSCPLVRCQYDTAIQVGKVHSGGSGADLSAHRKIMELTAAGLGRKEIAQQVGMSIRSVSRVRGME